MTDPQQPITLARAILQHVGAYYTTNNVPIPARQYVSPGLPAWDCEQVVVTVERQSPVAGDPTLEGPTAVQADPAFHMRAATIAITVVRCVPVLGEQGELTSTDDEEDAAELILADAGHVWLAIVQALDDGDLPGCGAVAFVSWDGLGPEGGLAGGLLRILASLE